MDTPDHYVDMDSLDIVELQMAMEAALDRPLTDAESEALACKLRNLQQRHPNALDGLDDDGLLGFLVRKPDPHGPLPRSGRAAARADGPCYNGGR